jgi:hypothetical protein
MVRECTPGASEQTPQNLPFFLFASMGVVILWLFLPLSLFFDDRR